MQLFISSQTGKEYTGEYSNPNGEGIRIIGSRNISLKSVKVTDSSTCGIYDYGLSDLLVTDCDVRRNGRQIVPDHLGKDTKGSGITLQGVRTQIIGGYVADNGNDKTLEHGIYQSRLALDSYIYDILLLRNSASGIKLSGSGHVEKIATYGSIRGVTLGVADTAETMTLVDSDISGTLYAVMVENAVTNTALKRFRLDYNRYPVGSKFSLRGTIMNLTQWKTATGLDKNSIEVSDWKWP